MMQVDLHAVYNFRVKSRKKLSEKIIYGFFEGERVFSELCQKAVLKRGSSSAFRPVIVGKKGFAEEVAP